uniref:THAP-type domain-containing protein n=1 Tax=Rhipicephalus appendiculatus TaxID=34631 RepID=A0A131YYW0_RHIAP
MTTMDETADKAPEASAAKRPKKTRHTYCFAPGCACSKTRHRREHDGRRCSVFGMPRNQEMFRRWQRYVPPRANGQRLTPNSALCERHFDPQFVQRYFEHTINGQLVRIKRGIPCLTPDAVPTIFPDSPSYYTRRVPARRKPIQRAPLPPPKRRRTSTKTTSSSEAPSADASAEGEEGSGVEPAPEAPTECEPVVEVVECEVTPAFPYKDLPLPSGRWARHVISETPLVIAYSTCRLSDDQPGCLVTEKLVLVREHEDYAECQVYMDGRRLETFEEAGSTDYPQTLLQRLDSARRCTGLGQPEEFSLTERLLPPSVEIRESGLHSVQCCGAATTRSGLSDKCRCAKKVLRKKQARLERRMRAQNVPPVSEVATDTERLQLVIDDASPGDSVDGEVRPDVEDSTTSAEVVNAEIVGDPLEIGNGESEPPPAMELEDSKTAAAPYRNGLGQVVIYVQ